VSSPGLLRSILADHWESVEPLLDRRLPPNVAEAVRRAVPKVLACDTPASGFVRYRCLSCDATHTVCFRCKCRLCPNCGIARAAEAAAKVQGRLLNVRHRHLTFCVPAELRPLLFWNRSLLSVVVQAAAKTTLTLVGRCCRKHPPLPGVMATLHTFGRDLGFHVHVHVLCTEGGLRADRVWQPVTYFPAQRYNRLWQYFLLTGLRRRLRGNRSATRLLGRLFRQYPAGFVVNVTSSYRHGRQAAAYCCRYTGRPPLSERRLVAYDGQRVTLAYRDYRDGQEKERVLPAAEFLLRLFAHVWPRYARDVHYYGLYQPPRRKEHARAVAAASRFGDQVLPVPALSRAERLAKALAGQGLRCPMCGDYLTVEHVEFPKPHHGTPSQQRTRPPPRAGAGSQLALPV
jgi:hypothetical protein